MKTLKPILYFILIFAISVTVFLPSNASALATINSPAPGSTLSCVADTTFSWTPDGGTRLAYWLWIGNSSGLSDIYNSGSLGLALSHTVPRTVLPTDGRTIVVRLWDQMPTGNWNWRDFTYTACNTPPVLPEITSPAPVPGIFPCGTFTFNWTSNGLPVTKWWIWAGDTGVGSKNLTNHSSSTTSSNPIIGMPEDGRPIYVRLFWTTKSSPVWPADWSYRDYTYTAASGCGTTCAGKSFVAAALCPIGAADGPTCDTVPVGAFCEGDGECGTNVDLNNCTSGSYLGDWYFRTQ